MIVRIPSPLRSYTGNLSSVNSQGASVDEVLANLNDAYPGIRFRIIDEQNRIRPHIQLFVNNELVSNLSQPVAATDVVHIIAALSGG